MMLHATASALPPAGVALPLAAAAVLYVRGAGRVQAKPRTWAFLAAWTTFGLALATPLHELGRGALALHMVQHVLLMSVAAPLLVWSRPSATLTRGVPGALRARMLALLRALEPLNAVLTSVLAAGLLYGAALWIWHAPALYSRGVTSALAHDAQHVTLILAGLIYWSSIARAMRRDAQRWGALLSLFLTTLHMGLLGALLTFSRVPWYAPYAGFPDALADQQLAGLIMWVPGMLPYVGAALLIVRQALQPAGDVLSSSPFRTEVP